MARPIPRRIALTVTMLTLACAVVHAATPAVPATTTTPVAAPASGRYVLFRLDPLGIEPQIVSQLEALLRAELGRVVGQELPPKAAVDKVALANPHLQNCTASPECLLPLLRAFKAKGVIAGNVGGLADSYVVNLKLVGEDGREIRRVAATLRGSPEELIDEIRVAAVRLVAPEQLTGAIEILSDVPGATVTIDGKDVGQTPLLGPIDKIAAGVHKVTVTREGFSSFEEEVPVAFEKTQQVVVRQSAVSKAAQRRERRRRAGELPIYSHWYVWTGVAAGAIVTGLLIGFLVPKQHAKDCAAPMSCP
jgi:hypothetical protein